MPAAARAGRPMIADRVPAGEGAGRGWRLGVSLLALTAALASAARAQTPITVGPGQTVTNTQFTLAPYLLTGNGGALINQGTIAPTSSPGVSSEAEPFSDDDLSSYRIQNITLTNNGAITGNNTNAVLGISVNGFTWTNNGTISTLDSSSGGFPTVYLNNVNNLQLTNNGTLALGTLGQTSARAMTLFKLTNSTIVNAGTIRSGLSSPGPGPALFLSGDSSNVTINNSGFIGAAAGGEAILIGNDGTAAVTTTIDGTHVFTLNPSATNVILNNSGVLAADGTVVRVGGTSSNITINNSQEILSGIRLRTNAIVVQDAASNVTISNSGNIAGSNAAIEVSSSGSGNVINNSGEISAGFLTAIDHSAGTAPLAISNSGTIFGGIVLSQPGDTVSITGGAINAFLGGTAVSTVTSGAGSVTFNAASFTTNGDFGTTDKPLGSITVAGGALNLGNALIGNAVTFAGGTTNLLSTVNAVAAGGNLNFSGGTLNLGTNALVLGANATVRTAAPGGSAIGLTIANGQNGQINARAGNATVDTTGGTLVIRPNLAGTTLPKLGSQYAVITVSSGANVSNALSRVSLAPGPTASMFSVGTATSTTDAYGNPLTPGKDIVLVTTGSEGSAANAAVAASNPQIEREQVSAITSGISTRIGSVVANVIAGRVTAPTGGVSGGDEPGSDWTVWADTSGNFLSGDATGAAYHGSIWTGLAGVDRPVGDNLIVGAVLGGEGDAFDLTDAVSRRSETGFSITPYVAYIISDWGSVDFEASYALQDNTVTLLAGQRLSNHFITNRFFATGNFTAYWNIDTWTLRGKFGYLWANVGGPDYTDAGGTRTRPDSTTLDEIKWGGEVTQHSGPVEPYLNLTAVYDLKGNGSLTTAALGAVQTAGHFGLQADAGARYKLENGWQFGLHFGGEAFRQHQSSVMAGVFARIPL